MSIQLDEIIKEANQLPLVPLKASSYYQDKIPILKKYVDDTLTSHPFINHLIGNNSLNVMYDNHTHHASFMATVFIIGNYELLSKTVVWVYRAYFAHNFTFDYFDLELKTWVKAVEKYMPEKISQEILSVYSWMIKNHEKMIYLSKNEKNLEIPISEEWLERKNLFLTGLLTGDHRKCLDIAQKEFESSKDISQFYLHIIQPVMYEIGRLWERGEISVAQEHLASAIVGRVMATTSMLNETPRQTIAKAVITAAPNEYHEIGAWMISDIIENEGWDVRYLGANTPEKDLLEILHSFKPQVLALSVTMPFNILKAKNIITSIKKDQDLKKINVIVGGRAFNDTNNLWLSTGADYFAVNAVQLKQLLKKIGNNNE